MGLCEGAWGGGEEVWACSWLAVNERGFDVQSQHSSTVLQISAEFQGQSLRGIPKIILVAFFFFPLLCMKYTLQTRVLLFKFYQAQESKVKPEIMNPTPKFQPVSLQ